MHTLAGLSDEVLDQIIGLSCLSVATLWCTGDPVLNKRLARCCTCVRTTDLASSTLKRWPRMLSSLTSLKTLILDVQDVSEDLGAVHSQLKELSHTLVHLELRFWLASILPMANSEVIDELTSTRRPLNLLEPELIKTAIYLSHRACWSLRSYFPSLQHVSFIEKHPSFKPEFDTTSMDIFPSSLTTLNWTMKLSKGSSLQYLPQSLTWLDFGDSPDEFTPGSDMVYPPLLTHLNGLLLATELQLAALPRSIVSGQWLWEPKTGHLDLSPGMLAALPPNMESLCGSYSLCNFSLPTDHGASLLPRNLTSLSITTHAFRSTDLMLLPRTLTFFDNALLQYDDIYATYLRLGPNEAQQIWPPKLARLSLARKYGPVTEDFFVVWPRSLTALLDVYVDSIKTFLDKACASCLPPNLISVSAFAINVFPEHSIDIKGTFPPQWRHLGLGGATFSISTIRKFPRELLTLHLIAHEIKKKDHSAFIGALPPKLETLAVGDFYNGAIPKLPLSVTSLIFSYGVPKIPYNADGSLPSGLTKIVVQGKALEFYAGQRQVSLS